MNNADDSTAKENKFEQNNRKVTSVEDSALNKWEIQHLTQSKVWHVSVTAVTVKVNRNTDQLRCWLAGQWLFPSPT